MTLKCCVIEPDDTSRESVANLIATTAGMELAGSFNSAHEAIKTVLGNNIDLAFVATELPEMSGIDFADIVPPSCRVVFLADTPDLAAKAFRVNALDYLIKPLNQNHFIQAASKAMSLKNGDNSDTEPQHIIVKSEYKLIQIPLCDILYIEGLKDYVKIYLAQDQKSVMSLMSIKAIEQYLPSSKFMRIHRSYIMNLSHIKTIERNRIIFGAHNIPISDTYRPQLNDYISSLTATIPATEE